LIIILLIDCHIHLHVCILRGFYALQLEPWLRSRKTESSETLSSSLLTSSLSTGNDNGGDIKIDGDTVDNDTGYLDIKIMSISQIKCSKNKALDGTADEVAAAADKAAAAAAVAAVKKTVSDVYEFVGLPLHDISAEDMTAKNTRSYQPMNIEVCYHMHVYLSFIVTQL
jgi:hypothetical protein